MVCCDLLFYWLRFEYREHRNGSNNPNTGMIITEEGQDDIDSCNTKTQVKKYKISIQNRLMCVYALIEMILLAMVLFLKKGEGYPNNFYKNVFSIDNKGVINKMIAVRLLTGFLFFLGAKMEVAAFKIPWFVVIISGYAPYWQIITSSFIDYDGLGLNGEANYKKIAIIFTNLTTKIYSNLPKFS